MGRERGVKGGIEGKGGREGLKGGRGGEGKVKG